MCTRDYVRIVHVEACSVRITRRCVIPLLYLSWNRSDKQKKRTSVLLIVKVITVLVFLQHTLLASNWIHTDMKGCSLHGHLPITWRYSKHTAFPSFRRSDGRNPVEWAATMFVYRIYTAYISRWLDLYCCYSAYRAALMFLQHALPNRTQHTPLLTHLNNGRGSRKAQESLLVI